jgi:hypothetical protein
MSLVKRVIAALLLTGAAALLLASSTLAQERVGVVTNIEGVVRVVRVALPEPRPLHFKGWHDQIRWTRSLAARPARSAR